MIKHYMEKLINKGTGAGGYKTTLNGKLFEHITSIETNLIFISLSCVVFPFLSS